jgi:hypothetical protein
LCFTHALAQPFTIHIFPPTNSVPAAEGETFLVLLAEEDSCFNASPYSLQLPLFDGLGIQQKKMRRLAESEFKNIKKNTFYSTICLL